MKEVLAKTNAHPGYALYEIQKKRLHHMVHVDCKSDESDAWDSPERIFEHAKYTYEVDFSARKLRVWKEQRDGRYTWVDVPLRERLNRLNRDQLETLQEFKIFENAEVTESLMRNGPRNVRVRVCRKN
jgi:hypothetical protein